MSNERESPLSLEQLREFLVKQRDLHDVNECEADAMDCIESAKYHERHRKVISTLIAALDVADGEAT